MTAFNPRQATGMRYSKPRQQGVVLLFALIAVLIVMLSAVALIRSFNSSLFSAGNIAFKRDLQNESEMAIRDAMTDFRAGGLLDSRTKRAGNVPSANYSASALATTQVNHQSIPLALQSDSAMASTTNSVNGFTKGTINLPSGTAASYRYVIERLCDSTGDENTLGTSHCLIADVSLPGGQGNDQKNAGVNPAGTTCGNGPCQSSQSLNVVYRVTVRVQGPRNTLSFFQSTLTAP